ncbi:MAG: type II toxin-antitoxin system YoeB family toxin [Actinomycetota bacterium]|nr:type II toxin-antitoxin system YoeB family toxin [Actinomycetota bacterium]
MLLSRDAYRYWQSIDRTTLGRLNRLFDDIVRDPLSETGKPEPLCHVLAAIGACRAFHRARDKAEHDPGLTHA